MRRFLALLAAIALVALVQTPVAGASTTKVVDFESSASTNDTGMTITLPGFTVADVSDRLLVVGISTKSLNGLVTGVTYGGQSLTQEIKVNQAIASTSGAHSEIWSLVAPSAGTADVVVTLNQSVQAVVGATLYSNVDQSDPIGVSNSNTFPAANTNSTTLNGAASGSLVFSTVSMTGVTGIHDGINGLFGSIAPAAGTERYEDGSSGAILVGGAGATVGAADPLTFQWNWTAKTSSCCDTAVTAVEIKAAPNLAPVVSGFSADDVSVAGQAVYTFTIEYSDEDAIDVSTIDLDDVTVTGPGGPLTVTSGVELTGVDGSPKTGTHTVMPPGGTWDAADVGTYTIGIVGSQVFDIYGAAVAANSSITTFEVTTNSPPTADAGGPYSVDEGGSVVLDASASSDAEQSTESLTFEWDLDNDGNHDDATGISPTFSAAGRDGPGSQTVGLRVSDSDGATDETTTTVTIDNVAPAVNASLDLSEVLLGLTVSSNSTFSDPGLTDDPWAYTISWGDSSSDAGTTSDQSTAIVASHVYLVDGVFTVEVCATDKDGATGCDTTSITVKTPEEALGDLEDDLDDLVTNGDLLQGQANSLQKKIGSAINKLDMSNKNAALNKLSALLNEVDSLIADGDLSAAAGQEIIDQINLIIDSINATC